MGELTFGGGGGDKNLARGQSTGGISPGEGNEKIFSFSN